MSEPETHIEDDDKDVGFLSFRSSIRTYGIHEIDQVFADIAETLETELTDKMKAAGAKLYGEAARSIGTHNLKTSSNRAQGDTFCFPRAHGNMPPKLFTAGSAGVGKVAKAIMRPIAIEGQEGEKSFVERLVEGDMHVTALRDSFRKALGNDALVAIDQALSGRHARHESASLWFENFPVFFIPGPDGQDLQTTPLSSIEAYETMGRIKGEAWDEFKKARDTRTSLSRKDGDGDAALPEDVAEILARGPGDWTGGEVSGKIRNIAMQLNSRRYRFRATMPDGMSAFEVGIWRLAQGGPAPRLASWDLGESLVSYAKALRDIEDPETYNWQGKREALDARADFLIREAVAFRAEIEGALEEAGLDQENATGLLPSVSNILRHLPMRKDDRAFGQASLNRPHFRGRLKIKGEE